MCLSGRPDVGFLIPGEVRVFDVAEFNAAEAWIIDPS